MICGEILISNIKMKMNDSVQCENSIWDCSNGLATQCYFLCNKPTNYSLIAKIVSNYTCEGELRLHYQAGVKDFAIFCGFSLWMWLLNLSSSYHLFDCCINRTVVLFLPSIANDGFPALFIQARCTYQGNHYFWVIELPMRYM